jgi:hypothetical protein
MSPPLSSVERSGRGGEWWVGAEEIEGGWENWRGHCSVRMAEDDGMLCEAGASSVAVQGREECDETSEGLRGAVW